MKNSKVSLFEGYKLKHSVQQVYLFDWVCSGHYRDEATFIRSLSDKSEQRKYKAKLPCITPSGIFSYCSDDSLERHSGFICIDIDGGDENPHITDFEALKQDLSDIEYIAYAGLSISGNGVFCLVPIAYPQYHKAHYYALEKLFQGRGVKIDGSCKNVSRLRGASYDANPLLNINAVTFTDMDEQPIKSKKQRISVEYEQNTIVKTPQNIPMIMVPILHRIKDNWMDITGDRRRWFSIGCALAGEYGEEGRDIFHAVSQFYKTKQYYYTREEANDMFDSCLKSHHTYKIKIGTFYHWCREYGML